MDIFMVLEQFKTLTGLTAAEVQEYLPSCAVAIAGIKARLKSGIDIAENKAILTAAAAANAFYEYVLVNATVQGNTDFKAGDIRIKDDMRARIKAAKELRDNAFSAISHLLKDTDFSFEAVEC